MECYHYYTVKYLFVGHSVICAECLFLLGLGVYRWLSLWEAYSLSGVHSWTVLRQRNDYHEKSVANVQGCCWRTAQPLSRSVLGFSVYAVTFVLTRERRSLQWEKLEWETTFRCCMCHGQEDHRPSATNKKVEICEASGTVRLNLCCRQHLAYWDLLHCFSTLYPCSETTYAEVYVNT